MTPSQWQWDEAVVEAAGYVGLSGSILIQIRPQNKLDSSTDSHNNDNDNDNEEDKEDEDEQDENKEEDEDNAGDEEEEHSHWDKATEQIGF